MTNSKTRLSKSFPVITSVSISIQIYCWIKLMKKLIKNYFMKLYHFISHPKRANLSLGWKYSMKQNANSGLHQPHLTFILIHACASLLFTIIGFNHYNYWYRMKNFKLNFHSNNSNWTKAKWTPLVQTAVNLSVACLQEAHLVFLSIHSRGIPIPPSAKSWRDWQKFQLSPTHFSRNRCIPSALMW